MQATESWNELWHPATISGVRLGECREHETFLDVDSDLDENETDRQKHQPMPESDQKNSTGRHPEQARVDRMARDAITDRWYEADAGP
jgi:hypothetical protein